ncbi:7,8-epoxymelianol synthase CYP88A154-like [Nicotiana tabacum]|uniref:7,8-epoxymelianol synthase CYP88A154-like n=2 Tax=Nicotiana tabacum TaxID=4097 RepID=A0AC58SNR1_TOBAC
MLNLIGKKALHGITNQEHKRLRRITTAPIKGQQALSLYLGLIEEVVKSSYEKWAEIGEKPVEFVSKMKKATFEVIIRIMMGSEIDPKWLDMVEKVYKIYSHGFMALPINLPGFAYHRAFKARANLIKIFQSVIDERKVMNMRDKSRVKCNMVDLIMCIEDEEGKRLSDEEIIDLLIVYAFAGHETTAHTTAWAIMYLEQHPEFFQKAKEEQQEIVKNRLHSDKNLSYDEIRQMKYLTKVIDETLRCSNITLAIYRNAKRTINMNGYTIPKGWKVLTWIRQVHLDPNNYVNPKEFNPLRWDAHETKPFSAFLPFGAGPRLCPGAELARLEVSVFLHYFLLYYRLERLNPEIRVAYLPIPSPTDNCLARLKKLSTSCQ